LVSKRTSEWGDYKHKDGLDEGDTTELGGGAGQLVDKPEQRNPLDPTTELEPHSSEQQ
jgi:hypothetical protein